MADQTHKQFLSPEAGDLQAALAANDTISAFNYGDFRPFLAWLATLRVPVDAFFENVTVNAADPEIRRNHLALLAQLRDTMHQIADFSKIEG